MILTDNLKNNIKEHAVKLDIEACGLILFKKDYFVYPCENVSEFDKTKHGVISPKDYLHAAAQGKVVGFYHSHLTDDDFGEKDKEQSEVFQLPLVLYKKLTGFFDIYYPTGYQNPYIGRNFVYGKSDCFALTREYYERELNIKLGNYILDSNWVDIQPLIFEDNYEKEGFVPVKLPQKNDCILLKYKDKDIAGHVGVFIGNNSLLHHPENRYSRIELYTDALKRRTKLILRHKTLCKI